MLDFSPRESELLEERQELFQRLGFDLAKSGENQFRLCSLPADIPVGEAETTLRKILEWLTEMHAPTAAEIRHACIAMTACKAAIKAGREYAPAHIEWLVAKLMELPDVTFCPHGRPVAMELSKQTLDRQFDRTGF